LESCFNKRSFNLLNVLILKDDIAFSENKIFYLTKHFVLNATKQMSLKSYFLSFNYFSVISRCPVGSIVCLHQRETEIFTNKYRWQRKKYFYHSKYIFAVLAEKVDIGWINWDNSTTANIYNSLSHRTILQLTLFSLFLFLIPLVIWSFLSAQSVQLSSVEFGTGSVQVQYRFSTGSVQVQYRFSIAKNKSQAVRVD
jgi:hypothetical protein